MFLGPVVWVCTGRFRGSVRAICRFEGKALALFFEPPTSRQGLLLPQNKH
jgi:hypothetical protein